MAILQIASDAVNNGDDTAIAVLGSEPASGSVIALFAFMRNGGNFTFPASYAQEVVATGAFDVDWTWTTVTESVGVLVSYGVPAPAGATRGSRPGLMGCS